MEIQRGDSRGPPPRCRRRSSGGAWADRPTAGAAGGGDGARSSGRTRGPGSRCRSPSPSRVGHLPTCRSHARSAPSEASRRGGAVCAVYRAVCPRGGPRAGRVQRGGGCAGGRPRGAGSGLVALRSSAAPGEGRCRQGGLLLSGRSVGRLLTIVGLLILLDEVVVCPSGGGAAVAFAPLLPARHVPSCVCANTTMLGPVNPSKKCYCVCRNIHAMSWTLSSVCTPLHLSIHRLQRALGAPQPDGASCTRAAAPCGCSKGGARTSDCRSAPRSCSDCTGGTPVATEPSRAK